LHLVAELDQLLGIAPAIDAGSPPIKSRKRGLGPGRLIVSLAGTMLAGGDFLIDPDHQRKDRAGLPLRAVPDVPASTTAIALGKRFCPEVSRGVERANAALVRKVFSLLPKKRREQLIATRPTIDLGPPRRQAGGCSPGPQVIGAVRVLQQLRRHRFSTSWVPRDRSLDGYKVVVVPGSDAHRPAPGGTAASLCRREAARSSSRARQRLRAKRGGGSYAPSAGKWVDRPIQHHLPPAVALGVAHPARTTRPEGTRGSTVARRSIPAKTLAEIVYPYFERSFDHFSGHSYTPPEKLSARAAVPCPQRESGRFRRTLLAGWRSKGTKSTVG
jgi:hypothetical protein